MWITIEGVTDKVLDFLGDNGVYIDAEEAVSKAKENLLAAEETLKKIKGKDND